MKTTFTVKKNDKRRFILFADLKAYSANKEDLSLISRMEEALYHIGADYFPENDYCFKVLGDGLLAVDHHPLRLAEKALQIVHYIEEVFKNDNDFKEKPQIRIALHMARKEEITERYLTYALEGGNTFTIFKDVAGEHVINTARIEPIVKPNFVFCSQDFADAIDSANENGDNSSIQTKKLDTYKLGKGHDNFEMPLYVVYTGQVPDTDMLKKHIASKLDDYEKTYKDVSPLVGFALQQVFSSNIFQQIDTHIENAKNVLKDVSVGDVGGDFRVGDNITTHNHGKTTNQTAKNITNIDKIDKIDNWNM